MPASSSEQQTFRANLSQFRWARGATDDSAPPPAPTGNPFARFYNAVAGDYAPLRGGGGGGGGEEEGWLVLSRWERCVLPFGSGESC